MTHDSGHPVLVTHVVLVGDAQLARHPQHAAVPKHRVNGQGLAPRVQGAPVIKQQVLDVRAGASLKQRRG